MARNKWGTAVAIAVGLLTMAVGLSAAPAAAATAAPESVSYSSSSTPLTIQSSSYGDVSWARQSGARSGAWAGLAGTDWTSAGSYCDGSPSYQTYYWAYSWYGGYYYPVYYWVSGYTTTCSYTFSVEVPEGATGARFAGSAMSDNDGWLEVDGAYVTSTGAYNGPANGFDVPLSPGSHVVRFNVQDYGGPSGLIFKADLTWTPAVLDADGDGVADDQDAFPNDPTETTDTDGDGVGDNGDAFPTDATESADADEDGTGDNADVLDDDPLVGAVALTADGVCGVVKSFVTKAGVANSLCVKLTAGSFGAFGNELRAQTGKAITAQQATSLRSLVGLID